MEYMLFLGEANAREQIAPTDPAFGEYMAGWQAYNQKLIDGGHWIDGAQLQPVTTATTIKRVAGEDTIVDGPFAETKEQLGGYYLIEAPDLDAAMSWAARCPGATYGAIEVRPVWTM